MIATRRLLVAVALVGALGPSGAAPSAGREAPPKPTPGAPLVPTAPIIERVTSELVLIETFVTDDKGRPVPGLGVDDFVLTVDAHRKPIASVEYREAGPGHGANAPTVTREGSPAPAGEEAAAQAAETASAYPRRFVLFFEDGTSQSTGLTAARRATDKFLASGLAPTDQVALAVYDRRLKILHDFTTDREALRHAVIKSLDDPMRYSDFAREQEEHWKEFEGSLDRGSSYATEVATNNCYSELPRMRDVVKALRSLVDSLAPWRGYKAIVFMGDGIPEDPATPYFDEVFRVYGPAGVSGAGRCTLTQEWTSLTQATAAAGVAVHTIQTTGLAAGPSRIQKAQARRANALEALAFNTGGQSSSSNDIVKALNGAEEASRAYYVLGYVPEGPPDGAYHSVVVRCRKGGLRVRWRRGFTRLPPAEARARAIEAAYLLPELYPDMSIDFSAVAGPRAAAGRLTDLVIHVPGERVLFLPEQDRLTARLTVGLVAIDEGLHETFRSARAVRIALSGGLDAKRPSGINLYCRVRLPAAAQSVTAVVSDDAAAAVGGAHLRMSAAPAMGSDILGLSLYSLSEDSVWVEVPVGVAAGAGDDQPASTTIGPAMKSLFEPGEKVACGFRMSGGAPSGAATGSVPGAPAGPRLLQLIVLREDAPVREKRIDIEGPTADLVKTLLPVEGLASGDYVLAVREILPDQVIDRGTTSFRIR